MIVVIAVLLALILSFQDAPFVQPGGVSGELRTVDGVPAVAVRVIAVPVPPGNNIPDDGPNYFDLAPPTDMALTDNEGHYNFRDLAPGRYYIMAGVSGQATYYPAATNIRGASIVTVQSGEVAEGIDFKLMHRLGGKLSGRVKADTASLGHRTATITGGKLEDLLEVPVREDGSFEFGHVPPGSYLVSLYPPTPGIASRPIRVGDDDVSGVELVPLPTHKVTGRIVSKNGPIPRGILGFYTVRTYVSATIDAGGNFTVELHSARHQIDFAGLPVGYSVASVRIGSQDGSRGIVVGNADVSDVLITVNAPQNLARVRGQISGLAPARLAYTTLNLAGPIVGTMEAYAKADGTFEFTAVTPGFYTLTLPEIPEVAPITVVVDGPFIFNVPVVVPSGQ
jgi:hypothetical protein